jgi:MFS family permease
MKRELSQAASFWVSAGVVAHTLWTSAAPAMVYPLYAQEWNLTPTMTTAIFAIYNIVVVAVLVGFGDVSDFIGRRKTMLLGLTCSALGVLLFVIAPDVTTLFAGRILMGIGVGLSAGPATAALVEYSNGALGRASATTITSQALGYSSALLLGGFLVQYAPSPTRLSFAVLLGLLVMLLAVTWFLPETNRQGANKTWRPKLPSVRSDIRTPFMVSSFAVMTAYTHGVIISSLGAQIAKDLVRSDNAFVNSFALALFAISLGAAGLFAKRFDGRAAVIWGSVASIVGMGFLTAAVLEHSLALFIPATAISGVGYALLVYGGLAILNAVTPENVRGGVLSALYLLAYLFTGVLAVVLGKIATLQSMATATLIGAALMIGLSVIVMLLLSQIKPASRQMRKLPSSQRV